MSKFIAIKPQKISCGCEDTCVDIEKQCNECSLKPKNGYELIRIEDIIKCFILLPTKTEIQIDYINPKDNRIYTCFEVFDSAGQCFYRFNEMARILTSNKNINIK